VNGQFRLQYRKGSSQKLKNVATPRESTQRESAFRLGGVSTHRVVTGMMQRQLAILMFPQLHNVLTTILRTSRQEKAPS